MWAEAVNAGTNAQASLTQGINLPLIPTPPGSETAVVSQMFARFSRAVDWFMALKSHLAPNT